MCLLESAPYNMPFHPDLIKTIKPLPLPYPLLSPLPSAVPMRVPTYLPNLARSTPSRSITPLHSAAMTTSSKVTEEEEAVREGVKMNCITFHLPESRLFERYLMPARHAAASTGMFVS